MTSAMADFDVNSAIFRVLGRIQGGPVSTGLGPESRRMAELLMNSAIPSEGSMRTSWPGLRNLCCANLGDSRPRRQRIRSLRDNQFT